MKGKRGMGVLILLSFPRLCLILRVIVFEGVFFLKAKPFFFLTCKIVYFPFDFFVSISPRIFGGEVASPMLHVCKFNHMLSVLFSFSSIVAP